MHKFTVLENMRLFQTPHTGQRTVFIHDHTQSFLHAKGDRCLKMYPNLLYLQVSLLYFHSEDYWVNALFSNPLQKKRADHQ